MFQSAIVQWLFFFYFYCFFGWCFESAYVSIKEKHFVYCKNGFEIIIKILSDDNILIEAELNKEYKTIDELKNAINKTKIPYDKSN